MHIDTGWYAWLPAINLATYISLLALQTSHQWIDLHVATAGAVLNYIEKAIDILYTQQAALLSIQIQCWF